MVDRSRTWSKMQRWIVSFVAPMVIVAAVVGGVLVAGELSEFVERHSIPGFSTSDDETVASTGAGNAVTGPNNVTLDTARSSNARRARSFTGTTQLWLWSGASPGSVRTVTLAIDPRIYPVDGVKWYLNGAHDRNDIHGPLDAEFGLWHSSTRQLSSGDVVSACWTGRDGRDRCPQTVVR